MEVGHARREIALHLTDPLVLQQVHAAALVTWQRAVELIVGLHADLLTVNNPDPQAGEGEMMSALEYDCEMEEREITLRELDRETSYVLDTSHVADQVR